MQDQNNRGTVQDARTPDGRELRVITDGQGFRLSNQGAVYGTDNRLVCRVDRAAVERFLRDHTDIPADASDRSVTDRISEVFLNGHVIRVDAGSLPNLCPRTAQTARQ